jgi:hypothetical protein
MYFCLKGDTNHAKLIQEGENNTSINKKLRSLNQNKMSGMNGCWHLAVNVCLAVMNPVEDVCPPLKSDALQKIIIK